MSWLSKIASPIDKGINTATLGLTNFGGQGNFFTAPFGKTPGMPAAPSWAADQAALTGLEQQQQGQTNQFMTDTQNRYTQQQGALQNVLNQYRQNAETDLSTGDEGEKLREEYNRLGLLNSGAFNDALAQKFADIQQQSDMELMNQGLNTTNVLQGIAQGGYQNQLDLGQAGLQRQYGLEDEQYQAALNQALAKMKDQNASQNATIGALGSIGGGLLAGLCFVADTPVKMADGSHKRMEDISLGDETQGGVVVSTRQAMSDDLYEYHGVRVTGSHAVLDDGEWKRVKKAKTSTSVPGVFKVYSIVTSKHRIYVADVTFADELEHDHYNNLREANADMDASLIFLNKELVIGRV